MSNSGYKIIPYENETQWLKARKKHYGGSEIAGILGLDSYNTPLDVYLRKTNRSLDVQLSEEQKEDFDRGHWIEKPMIEWVADRTGIPLKQNKDLYISNENELFLGTPDALTDNFVCEIKSTRKYIDELPESWFIQSQWYAGITGHENIIIAWIDGKLKRDYQTLRSSKALINFLQTRVMEFHNNYVLKDMPPPPINAADMLKIYNTHVDGKLIEATEEMYYKYMELKMYKEQIKLIEEKKELIENEIKMYMTDSEKLMYSGRELATYKGYSKPKFDTDRFKNAEPIIYQNFCKETITRRFLPK